MRNGTASILKPETPSSSQHPMMRMISWRTAGLIVSRSASEIVEAMEVEFARDLVVGPGRLLHPREHHSLRIATRPLFRPHVQVAVRRSRVLARLLEPGVLDGCVV